MNNPQMDKYRKKNILRRLNEINRFIYLFKINDLDLIVKRSQKNTSKHVYSELKYDKRFLNLISHHAICLIEIFWRTIGQPHV